MAKAILNSLVTAISGKITTNSKLVFRRNANGTVSIYQQKKHKRKSLHSPAQERHRQLLAMASVAAGTILSNPDGDEYAFYNESYIQYCSANPYAKQFYCLRSYIIHCLFKKFKHSSVETH